MQRLMQRLMQRKSLIPAILCFISLSQFAQHQVRAQSPLFQIGHPVHHPFAAVVTGYGALSQDQSHVAIYVAASDLSRVKAGNTAAITLIPSYGQPVTGRGIVKSILKDADPKTGQGIVTIGLVRQSVAARTYATAVIEVSSKSVLAIPSTALMIEGGRPQVLLRVKPVKAKDGSTENEFEKKVIVIGEQRPDFIEVKEGLSVSDEILVLGALEWAAKGSSKD